MKRPALRAKAQPAFIAVDFFCGAGGTTRGLIDAGGVVIAGVDKDDKCRDTYVNNNINLPFSGKSPQFLQRDIFPEADKADLEQSSDGSGGGEQAKLIEELSECIATARKTFPDVPLFFAICAPCQPFTTLSKSKLSEERQTIRDRDSSLLLEAAAIVKVFEPDIILSENVRGIGDARYGGVWGDFRSELERLGYVTGSEIVCTSKFGVPQMRRRSILVGIKEGSLRPDMVQDGPDRCLKLPIENPDEPLRTVRETLKHLPSLEAGSNDPTIPNHRTRSLSALNVRRISCSIPGASNGYMTQTPYGDLSLACHRKVNAKFKQRCFNDVYTRMDPDKPSPTITTKCHSISNGRFGHYDTKQNRGISLREAALLQSFPEDYLFYPPHQLGPVAKMIGNAVPPKLAQFFATYAVEGILDRPVNAS